MSIATVTSKGQITLPAAIRAELHIAKGDRVEFVKVAEGRYEMIAAWHDVKSLKGLIKTRKKITLEEMDNAIKARAGKNAPVKNRTGEQG